MCLAAGGPVGDECEAKDVLEEWYTGKGAEELVGSVFGADLVQTLEIFGA